MEWIRSRAKPLNFGALDKDAPAATSSRRVTNVFRSKVSSLGQFNCNFHLALPRP